MEPEVRVEESIEHVSAGTNTLIVWTGDQPLFQDPRSPEVSWLISPSQAPEMVPRIYDALELTKEAKRWAKFVKNAICAMVGKETQVFHHVIASELESTKTCWYIPCGAGTH